MTQIELEPLSAQEAQRELDGDGRRTWVAGAPSEDDVVVLRIAAAGIPTWLMVQGGHCVGMIGTHEQIEPGGTPEIGYHVDPAVRGRGVATGAVGLLLAELARAGVAGVVAEVDRTSPHGAASLGVLRANGFERLDPEIVTQLFVEPVDGADLLHRLLP